MEPENQKIISLLEEIVQLQKTSYNNAVELTRKINQYKKGNMVLVVLTLGSILYAVVISMMYYNK